MRRGCTVLLLVAGSLLVPKAARALSLPRVEAHWASEAPAVLGRPVTLIVEVDHEAGSRVQWPKALNLGSEIEERSRQVAPPQSEGGILHSRAEFVLMAFDAGILPLPAVEVAYAGPRGESRTLRGPALALAVLGTVDSDKPVLRPMASTRSAPVRDWNTLALLGGAVLGLVLVTVMLGRWTRKRKVTAVALAEGRLSPHDEALASLRDIEASGRIDGDALKPVFHEMSEIIRLYLGRRFDFPALDLTSSEIQARLRKEPDRQVWCDSVTDWLSKCDLVKYAGSQVSGDEARTTLYRARLLIEKPGEESLPEESPVEADSA